MDIKKQPKPWYIRYRYPILSGAAGIAILSYALFLIVCGCRRTGSSLQDHPGKCDGEWIRGTGGG